MKQLLIAHRGNINGPEPQYENRPDYIIETLHLGFNVEVDVWSENGMVYLGHDEPTYRVHGSFLFLPGLWIHAKNIEIMEFLNRLDKRRLNFFYHDRDDYTLTSLGYIWAYPGKISTQGRYAKTIAVMPPEGFDTQSFFGICADNVNKISNI